MKPTISVIIPNYNRANLIGETLNNMLLQALLPARSLWSTTVRLMIQSASLKASATAPGEGFRVIISLCDEAAYGGLKTYDHIR